MDGTVVKYIGDAIFAFWNAPEAQEDHAFRACQAALLMRDHNRHEVQGRPLVTRIGIHTGTAHVGNFGSEDRVDYTAQGESVNLASRLEGVNKFLNTTCLISQATKDGIGDRLVTRYVGLFQVKGMSSTVGIHELVSGPELDQATLPWRRSFEQALENYRDRNLEFAQMGFRETLELKPQDGPSLFYLSRIDAMGPEAIPVDWDGRTQLWEK
jgi:adenylate cyclase